MSGPCTDCGGPDYQTLEARIAELGAENLKWQDESLKNLIRAGEAEAERDALRSVYRELTGKDWKWDPRPREETT